MGGCHIQEVKSFFSPTCKTIQPNSSCLLLSRLSPVNTSDILTIESEKENRFVLEQLWSSGYLHHTVWLGMYFNIDSEYLSPCRIHLMIPINCSLFSLSSGLCF